MKSRRILTLALSLFAFGAVQLHATETGGFDKTLQVNGNVDLNVVSGSGNITVHTGASSVVHISAKIRARDQWFGGGMSAHEKIQKIQANPPIEQTGNSIRIGRIEDHELQQNVSIDYDLTVPAQTRLTSVTGSGDQNINGVQLAVSAKTGSGNITLDNIGADVRVSSGSGDLKINSIKGALAASAGSGNIRGGGIAGEINANTGSGEVELEQAGSGNVKVGTGSGNVKLRGVKRGLRVETGSGDIRVDGEPTGDWHASAGSGNIDLRVPASTSFNIDARTSSGTLRMNRPVTMQGNLGNKHVQGKVGNGGVLVDLHTGSGDIQVE
ncbi:MAG: hypothetical protein DMG65_14360 [Candidatus Angelobacter sp. Gp1-AA117]|nr:MAG: hypothetical protein DMG65_14360 [Candidatus Angelobacter sp. Gp1-AA117]